MNDESDNPLTPVGDDALEARIVAWVLGEASSFEAAELEKLCAEDPVLGIFAERMRVLHGLLAADAKSAPDAEWRLPEAKRAKITDLLGVDVEEPVIVQSANRYFARRSFLAAAACLMISLVAYTVFGPGFFRKHALAEAPAKSVDFMPASQARGEANARVRTEALREADQKQDDEADFSAAKERPEIATAVPEPLPELEESQSELAGGAGGRGHGIPPSGRTRASANFTGTVDGVDLAGVPAAAAGTNVTDMVTGGNRSGDGVINRNNIDAVLNNPNRAITGPVEPMGRSSGGLPAASKPAQQMFSDGEDALAKKSSELALEGKLGKGMKQEEEVRYKVDSQDAPAAVASPAPADALASAKDRKDLADSFASEEPAIETASRRPRPESAVRLGLEAVPSQDAALAAGNAGSDADHFFGSISPAENEQLLEYRSSSSGETTKSKTGDRFAWSVRDEATKAPAAFDSLKEMGAFAEDLKAAQPPVAWVGGLFRSDARQPSIAQGQMDLDSLSSLDREQAGGTSAQSLLDGYGLNGALNTNTTDANLWAKKIEEAKGGSNADPGQLADTNDIRRRLYIAEGNYNLGKYDEASRAYEDIIRLDPYNKAARRGMETVAQAKQDYHRAAHDQTRAELLAQVEGGWEIKLPEDKTVAGEKAQQQQTAGSAAASNLAQQEMLRRQNAIGQADGLREAGRKDYAEGNYAGAYAKQAEAIQLLPDAELTKDRKADLSKQLAESAAAQAESERSKGDEAQSREWAGKALQWDSSNTRAKAILELTPGDETSATAEPFSTFSLHVSDASFKLAKAALDRGEQPDPASIRPEEFYNSFDYGDPSPGRGEPVACALEQAAHPAIPQRNLLRIGVRTGSAGRGQSTPLNLTLLLDSSGSMEREDRHVGMTLAIQQLSGLLKEGDTISVVGFSRTPRLLADRLPGARAAELNALIAQTPSEGGTNLEEGLKIAGELAQRQFNPAAQNRVVLFTDGAANLGDAQPETLQAKVEAMRQQGIAFDAAGFGADGLNDRLLERLTRNGNGRYYVVDNAEDANANFSKQLAGAFRPAAENVKVQVRFNPARVGRYKLIGFEEHRLNKEDFHNDAVDAAEMAAEEAGNALYQVEAQPGGEGEIGEVSVRFRDVASGQMVERTWTIPYEAQSPAFDQAAPSIQLAGLAAFTAEKLRHAPMSDAIDFQQLGQTFGKVKARYQNSQAVSDLGTMIGKLK